MRIVIATPLYPPDVADPAPYVKELAMRLSERHDVTVVTYGRIPEAIEGVTILTTDKRLPTLLRLASFTQNLLKALRGSDALYLQSGISAEIPTVIARAIKPVPIWVRITTPAKGTLRGAVRSLMMRESREIRAGDALVRPEVHPFEEFPSEAFATYEAEWKKHLSDLTTI